ncbi:hypothetical protein, partial [Salmonella enterica]|uniref:hypothetical protein n=1 Tax=Salmonella enterica TaxID=28901 RepID=UPI003F1C6ABD
QAQVGLDRHPLARFSAYGRDAVAGCYRLTVEAAALDLALAVDGQRLSCKPGTTHIGCVQACPRIPEERLEAAITRERRVTRD